VDGHAPDEDRDDSPLSWPPSLEPGLPPPLAAGFDPAGRPWDAQLPWTIAGALRFGWRGLWRRPGTVLLIAAACFAFTYVYLRLTAQVIVADLLYAP
jgi:hypothetical protein